MPNPTSDEGTRLTTSRLMLWTLYAAVFSAIFSALPASLLSFGFATAVAIGFLLIDAFSSPLLRTPGVVAISFFSCGLVYAVSAGFFVLGLFPPPVPPKPPLPFWSGLFYLVSGGLLRDIVQDIADGLVLIFQYVIIVVACTVISTSAAFLTVRRRPHSKWLLLLNAPGILLCGWLVFVILYESLTTG